jgi:hypothetical protein
MGLRHTAILLAAFGWLLVTQAAHAQGTELGTRVDRTTEPGNGRKLESINYAECVRNDVFTFDVTPTAPAGSSLGDYQLEVWAGTGCKAKDARITSESCRLVFTDGPSSNGNRVEVEAQEIVADDGGKTPEAHTDEDCTSSTQGENKVSLFFLLVDGSDDLPSEDGWAEYPLTFDMEAPEAPTNVSAGVGENALVISWDEPEDSDGVSGYRFYCDPPPGGDVGEGGATGTAGASGTPSGECGSSVLTLGAEPPAGYECGSTSDTATNGEATGLDNGQSYAVAVATFDEYYNVGVLSEVACGIPAPVTGFFEAYRAAGGEAGGGFCAMHAGKSRTAAALFSLVLLGLVIRKRRAIRGRPGSKTARVVAALAVGASFLVLPGAAHAQGTDEFGAYGGLEDRGLRRSPQEAAFEIRVGPYRPNVDDAVAGSPYEATFGNSTRWHAGFEVDWQVLRLERTLSFGPGFSLGYTRAGAKAPLSDGSGRSSQDTEIEILPMFLAGVLRIDALADRTAIPLAPYAKLGFGYALWWTSDGESGARAEGVAGKGASYGYTYSLGVMLRLDPLDPADAASADASLGINHSGIFIEWFGSSLDGFGSPDVLEVGTNTWVMGLTIEM